MSSKKDRLLKKRNKLFYEVEKNLDFIKGSLVKVSRKNRIKGDFYHLTYKDENQKTHTMYIPSRLVKSADKGIKKMEKIKIVMSEISKINIELLKED